MTTKELYKLEEIFDLLVEAYEKKKIDFTYYCWVCNKIEELYNKHKDKTFQILDHKLTFRHKKG